MGTWLGPAGLKRHRTEGHDSSELAYWLTSNEHLTGHHAM
jgi:hypothetical protein